ncbi:hypothetical protein V8F06_003222 [Rhypophila decipiens]
MVLEKEDKDDKGGRSLADPMGFCLRQRHTSKCPSVQGKIASKLHTVDRREKPFAICEWATGWGAARAYLWHPTDRSIPSTLSHGSYRVRPPLSALGGVAEALASHDMSQNPSSDLHNSRGMKRLGSPPKNWTWLTWEGEEKSDLFMGFGHRIEHDLSQMTADSARVFRLGWLRHTCPVKNPHISGTKGQIVAEIVAGEVGSRCRPKCQQTKSTRLNHVLI